MAELGAFVHGGVASVLRDLSSDDVLGVSRAAEWCVSELEQRSDLGHRSECDGCD